MNYMNLITELWSSIEGFEEMYEKEKDLNSIKDTTEIYVIFGSIYTPYIMNLLNSEDSKNDTVLKKVFDFFEQMAICEDEMVREVLLYAVLEMLGDDAKVLKSAYAYMGVNTRSLSEKIEQFFGRKDIRVEDELGK